MEEVFQKSHEQKVYYLKKWKIKKGKPKIRWSLPITSYRFECNILKEGTLFSVASKRNSTDSYRPNRLSDNICNFDSKDGIFGRQSRRSIFGNNQWNVKFVCGKQGQRLDHLWSTLRCENKFAWEKVVDKLQCLVLKIRLTMLLAFTLTSELNIHWWF